MDLVVRGYSLCGVVWCGVVWCGVVLYMTLRVKVLSFNAISSSPLAVHILRVNVYPLFCHGVDYNYVTTGIGTFGQ